MMRFWPALWRALLHTLAALLATSLVWVAWTTWFLSRQGQSNSAWGSAQEILRFGLWLGFMISLILAGVFLLLSLFYHYRSAKFSVLQYTLSVITLAIPSLLLLYVLPDGSLPLIAAFIGLPALSTLWLVGRRGSPGIDHRNESTNGGRTGIC